MAGLDSNLQEHRASVIVCDEGKPNELDALKFLGLPLYAESYGNLSFYSR